MKSELQHSSGASRASFGLEMLVLQALVYRSAFQGSSDTLGSQGMDPSACCSCLLPWNNQFSSPGSLMVDKQCLVGEKLGCSPGLRCVIMDKDIVCQQVLLQSFHSNWQHLVMSQH